MTQGEVCWAQLDPPAGRRTVVLLARNEAYAVRSLVTVAPITTRVRDIAAEVLLGTDDEMPRECAASLDSIITIPRDCLQERLASLTHEKLRGIQNTIHFALVLTR